MHEIAVPQIFEFLKTHHELGYAMGNRMSERLEQEHNLQLKDLIIAREIHMGVKYPSEIAQKLRMPRDMVSRSIERLVQIGSISREIDPQDSRRTILSINPAGEERRKQVQQTLATAMQPVVESLSPEELFTLTSLMRKMLDAMYQQEGNKEKPCPTR